MIVKRGFIWIGILVLVSISVYSDSFLFSSLYTSQDILQFGSTQLRVNIDTQGQQVQLLNIQGGESYILQKNSEIQSGNHKIRFVDSEEIIDSQTQQKYYEVELELYALQPDLQVNWTLTEKGDYVGDEFHARLYIFNNGSKTAQKVSFVHPVIDGRVIQSSGCQHTQSRVFFEQNIESQKSITCTYRFIPLKPKQNENIFSTLFYEFEGIEYPIHPSPIELHAPSMINITQEFNQTSLDIAKSFTLNLSAINAYDEKISDIRMTYYIPDVFEIVKKPFSFEDNSLNIDNFQQYSTIFSLQENQNRDFEFMLKPKVSGTYPIYYSYSLLHDNNNLTFTSSPHFITVTQEDDPPPEILNHSQAFEFVLNITNQGEYTSFQKGKVHFAYKNKHIYNYSNVTATLYIDEQKIQSDSRFVRPLFLIRAFTHEYEAPYVSENTQIPIRFELNYTVNNENFIISQNQTLTIKPIQPVSFRTEISQDTVEVSQPVTIDVYATSTQPGRSFTYQFYERIPQEHFIIQGQTNRTLTLREDVEQLVYSYKLIPKDLKNQTTFSIPTIALSSYQASMNQTVYFNLSENKTVIVEPYTNSLQITASFPSNLETFNMYDGDFTVTNNGSAPIYDIKLYPISTIDFDVKHEIVQFEQFVPKQTQDITFKFRPRVNMSVSPKIGISYTTREGIFISQEMNAQNITVSNGDLDDAVESFTLQALQYWDGNITYHKSGNEKSLFFTQFLNQNDKVLFNTNVTQNQSQVFFSFSFLDTQFIRTIPVEFQIIQRPKSQFLQNESLVNESHTNQSLNDNQVDTNKFDAKLVIIGFGIFVFLILVTSIILTHFGIFSHDVFRKKNFQTLRKSSLSVNSKTALQKNKYTNSSTKKPESKLKVLKDQIARLHHKTLQNKNVSSQKSQFVNNSQNSLKDQLAKNRLTVQSLKESLKKK